jgi:hypothetical protein
MLLSTPVRSVLVAVALTYAGFFIYPGERWWASSLSAWDWAGICILLTGPLLAAGTAWWVRGLMRLVESGTWAQPDLRRSVRLYFLPLAGGAVALHALMVAACLVRARATGTDVRLDGAMLIPVHLAAIVMFVAIGMAVGVWVKYPWGAPGVGLVFILLPAIGYGSIPREIMLLGGGGGPPGYGPGWAFELLQFGMASGVTCAAVVVSGLGVGPILKRPLGRLFLIGTAVAVACASLLIIVSPDQRRPGPDIAERTCDVDTPSLCLASGNERNRQVIRSALNLHVDRMFDIGVQPAGTYIESGAPAATIGGDGTWAVFLPATFGQPDELHRDLGFVLSVIGPRSCLDENRLPETKAASVLLAAGWFQTQSGVTASMFAEELAQFQQAGADLTPWLKQVLIGYAECDEGLIPEPPGLPAP